MTSSPTTATDGSPPRKASPKGRRQRRSLVSPEVARALSRPPRHPWLTALAVIVVSLLIAEAWVRWVKPQLPVVRSGDAAEMILKARRIDDIAAAHPQLDMMFFGTSMMDSAVIPREMLGASKSARTAYNASIVGAPATTLVRWANEVALVDLRPKLIVVGVHPIDLLLTDPLNLNIQPGQADVVFARVERELRPGIVGAVDRAANDHVELVAQRGSLRQPKVMLEATWNQYRQNEPKPYIPLRDEDDWRQALEDDGTSKLFHNQTYKPTKALSDLRTNMVQKEFSVRDLNHLLGSFKTRGDEIGARVVVVIPPVPVEVWREGGVDMGSLGEGERLIKDASARYGFDVIDFTGRGYPTEMFADVLHSNRKGAVQFSHDLMAELERRGR